MNVRQSTVASFRAGMNPAPTQSMNVGDWLTPRSMNVGEGLIPSRMRSV
jgi:hypothetical protein